MTQMIVGWNLVAERTGAQCQAFVDRLPNAQWSSMVNFERSHAVVYPGQHRLRGGTRPTVTVAGGNADLRPDVAALACTTPRAVAAVRDTLTFVMTAYNRQHGLNVRYPTYHRTPTAFIAP